MHGGLLMSNEPRLVHLLRNVSFRELTSALVRAGFELERSTQTGSRVYRHTDGRQTIVHYHRGSERFRRKTLAAILAATRWTRDDVRRLGLL